MQPFDWSIHIAVMPALVDTTHLYSSNELKNKFNAVISGGMFDKQGRLLSHRGAPRRLFT